MWFAIPLVVGAAFGAGDQYLGSLSRLSWSWQVSGLSAPWLVLPFVVGAAQRDGRRAALVGATSALAAVGAYVAMILSPMEGVRLAHPVTQVVATLGSQWPWLLGAAAVAPCYGLLGHRWRTRGATWCLLVLAATCALEPLARALSGRLEPDATVWLVEVAAATSVAVWLVARRGVLLGATAGHRQRRAGPPTS